MHAVSFLILVETLSLLFVWGTFLSFISDFSLLTALLDSRSSDSQEHPVIANPVGNSNSKSKKCVTWKMNERYSYKLNSDVSLNMI